MADPSVPRGEHQNDRGVHNHIPQTSRIHGRQQAVRLERPAFPRRPRVGQHLRPRFQGSSTFEPVHREDAFRLIHYVGKTERLRPTQSDTDGSPLL